MSFTRIVPKENKTTGQAELATETAVERLESYESRRERLLREARQAQRPKEAAAAAASAEVDEVPPRRMGLEPDPEAVKRGTAVVGNVPATPAKARTGPPQKKGKKGVVQIVADESTGVLGLKPAPEDTPEGEPNGALLARETDMDLPIGDELPQEDEDAHEG